MLKVKKLSKSFKSGDTIVNAVNDVSFEIADNAFASIVGPSGSGKSTLLALLGALDKPTSGSIEVGGQEVGGLSDHQLIKYRSANVGFVFQNYNLIPNLNAIENVMLPMEFLGGSAKDQQARAKELLEGVGLDEVKQQRRPGRLSGGEQQRVAIARALANKPKLILADEPTGNLDSVTGKMIFDLLRSLARQKMATVVVVTHDLEVAGKTDFQLRLSDGKLVK